MCVCVVFYHLGYGGYSYAINFREINFLDKWTLLVLQKIVSFKGVCSRIWDIIFLSSSNMEIKRKKLQKKDC